MGFIRVSSWLVGLATLISLTAMTTDANAQRAPRIRGEIVAMTGNDITVKTPDGRSVDVTLDPEVRVLHAAKASLADIKPGSFIGTGAYPDGDSWKAAEVHIFPAGSRDSEGHRPWTSDPSGTMTNAEVTATVVGADRNQLTLTTNGQSYKITVPAQAPVVRFERGTKDLVKKGAWVGISNAVEQNGKRTAKAITVSGDKRYPVN